MMGESMRVHSWLLALLVVATALSSVVSPIEHVQASGGCDGEVVPIEWNQTVQRHAMVPFDTGMYYYDDFEAQGFDDDGEGDGNGRQQDSGSSTTNDESHDDSLHPEEAWMHSPAWPLNALDPLEEGIYTTMQIGNDSSGALRINLSSTHRTTVCVNLFSQVGNASIPATADVYLMTTAQYERYEIHYDTLHNSWGYWGNFNDIDEALSEVPPEWRSVTPNGWKSYRDVHEYEQITDVTFSVALDAPEIYDSLLGDANWQDFYLVVDNWDNGHDGDQTASSSVVVAEVSIIPTERSLVLPTWSVPLVFFAAMAVLVAAPFILNKRYMEAGMVGVDAPKNIPLMTQTSALAGRHGEEE